MNKKNESTPVQRVAVYCRVSTERPADDSSYMLQRQYYEKRVPDKKRALMQFVEELEARNNRRQSWLIDRFADDALNTMKKENTSNDQG